MSLADVLLEQQTDSGAVLRDGIVAAVSPLTVIIPPSTVASPATALNSANLAVGNFVQVLVQGANRLVIGAVGGSLGEVFYTQTATNVTTAGTTQSLFAGLAATGWTAVAGRRYKLTCQYELTQSVASDVYMINLINQAVPVNLNRVTGSNVSTAARTAGFEYVTNASIAGSQDWRIGVFRASGTGTIDLSGVSSVAFLLIEDIGPL